MKGHHLDVLRVAGGDYTRHERQLRRALKILIGRANDLIAAIDGTTDQFEPEVAALSDAASGVEKVFKPRRGVS